MPRMSASTVGQKPPLLHTSSVLPTSPAIFGCQQLHSAENVERSKESSTTGLRAFPHRPPLPLRSRTSCWRSLPLALGLIGFVSCSSGNETPEPSVTPSPSVTPGTPTSTPLAEAPKVDLKHELLLAADNGSNQFKVIDPEQERVVYSLNLGALQPNVCGGEEDCFIFGGHHHLLDGHDYVTISYGLQTTRGLNTGFEGYIDRVALTTPPTLRWRLHNLNFSNLPGGSTAYCPAAVDNPCQAQEGLPVEEAGLCWVGDAHDIEVLSDDPVAQKVELIVVDTDNLRLLRVALDYANGNTCGEVTSIVDAERHADWPEGGEPNHLLRVPNDEGRELYLITQRAQTHTEATDGDGAIQLWEYATGSWTHYWTFPEPIPGEDHAFSLPHGGELLLNATPQGHLFRFAHSASLATDRDYKVNDSDGGSIGVLLLTDLFQPPDYLYDLYFAPGTSWQDVWRFPRFAEQQPDGSIMVTDSGCQADVRCDWRARIYWIPDDVSDNSSLGGFWDPQQSQLALVPQQNQVLHSLQCGLISPFWVQRIDEEDYGQELTQAKAAGGTGCPELN